MIDPATSTEAQLAEAIQNDIVAALADKPMTHETITEAALAAARPYLDALLPNDGTFWIGNRLCRFGQPMSRQHGRSMSIPIEEVPTYTFTVTIDPNKTAEE